MLQLAVVKDQTAQVIAGLTKRNYKNAEAEIAAILEIDQRRRKIQLENDEILSRSNSLAKEIGNLMKNGEKAKAEELKTETASLKTRSKTLSEELSEIETELHQLLVKLPNIPHESVPAGRSAEDNENIFQHGEIPTLHEGALPHWELIKKYDIIDFELG